MNASPNSSGSHPEFSQLVEFAFGKLDSQQLESVANHLEECPECCELLTQASLTDLLLEKLQDLSRRSSQYSPEVIRSVALAMARQDTAISASSSPPLDRLQWINQYRIEAEVGRGGMGVVYKAIDVALNRPVALKVLLDGQFTSTAGRVRFRQEAELAARVCDPRVVQVYEIGEFHGQPFVAFEWIEGSNLADARRQRQFTPVQAVELMEQLALAVHVAHTQGIIHRDLKPANILLTPEGAPKIVDFGLARLHDQAAGLTISGSVLGTPHYMAPEQALSDSKFIGPCSDVYALGAILYELLSGRLPFAASSSVELLRLIVQAEPVSIRAWVPSCPNDLDVIVRKCLSKKINDRYQTALELAEDLRRFLHGLPIMARPIGRIKKSWLWCKRNPVVAGLIALVFVTLNSGIIVSSRFAYLAYQEALKSEADARAAKASAELAHRMTEVASLAKRTADANAYDANALLLQNAWKDKEIDRFLKIRDKLRPADDQVDLRGFEWYYWNSKYQSSSDKLVTGAGFVGSAIYNRDGSKIAYAEIDGRVTLWDNHSGKSDFSVGPDGVQIYQVRFCADDSQLVTARHDGLIKVLDAKDGHEVRMLAGHAGPVTQLKETPEGLLSRSEDGTIRLWNLETGQELYCFDPQSAGIGDIDVAQAATRMISCDGSSNIYLWDLKSRRMIAQWSVGASVGNVAFSADGQSVVIGSPTGVSGILDAQTGKPRWPLLQLLYPLVDVCFDSSGRSFYIAGIDSVVRHYSVDNGTELEPLIGHSGIVGSLECHPSEADTLLSAGADGTVRRWNPQFRPNPIINRHVHYRPLQFDYDASGRLLAVPSVVGGLELLDVREATSKLVAGGFEISATLFARHNSRVYGIVDERELGVWNLESQEYTKHALPSAVYCLVVNAAEDRLVLGGANGRIFVYDTQTMERLASLPGHQGEVRDVQFADDDQLLFSTGLDGALNVWDCDTWQLRKKLVEHNDRLFKLDLSPTTNALAVASEDGTVQIRDRSSGDLIDVLRGHGGPVRSVSYSPDGRRLATGGYDRTVRVWDTETNQEVLTFPNHPGDVMDVQFSPDGKHLASLANGGEVRVWRAD